MQPIALRIPTYHTMTPRLTPMPATPTPQADAFTPTTSIQRQGLSIPQAQDLVKVIGEQIKQATGTDLAKHISKWTGTQKRLEEALLNYKTFAESFPKPYKAFQDPHLVFTLRGQKKPNLIKTLDQLLSDMRFAKIHINDLDLSDLDLSELNLELAHLEGANLSRTNLTKTILRAANLTRANLTEALLKNTFLVGATLTEADFSKAKLLGITINISLDTAHALWQGAELRGVKLSEIQENMIKSKGGKIFKASDLSS